MSNTTVILVKDFIIDALIGIYPQELTAPQRICVNVDMRLKNHIIPHDVIEDTVSYEGMVNEIRRLSRIHHNLVETLAEKLANFALKDTRVGHVTIELTKLDIFSEGAVGVKIQRLST